MLKALWKKTLGSPGGESCNNGFRPNLSVSLSSHMTHTGEFHLERLTDLLCQRYGQTFGTADDEAIRLLIRYASRIQDQDIQRELLLFYLNCSPVIQDYLREDDVISHDLFTPPGASGNKD